MKELQPGEEHRGWTLFSQGSMKGTLARERLVGLFLVSYLRSFLRSVSSFVSSFFRSFVRSFVRSQVGWFVDLLVRWFVSSLAQVGSLVQFGSLVC